VKAQLALAALVIAMLSADVYALTPPSESDGPIKLLNCVVSPNGILEAEVDNQSDTAMGCQIRCNFDISGTKFSHWFEVTIPAQFHGRVGKFDTSGARPGNYSGDVGQCEKTDAHRDPTSP
jgi:hypothetical protein